MDINNGRLDELSFWMGWTAAVRLLVESINDEDAATNEVWRVKLPGRDLAAMAGERLLFVDQAYNKDEYTLYAVLREPPPVRRVTEEELFMGMGGPEAYDSDGNLIRDDE